MLEKITTWFRRWQEPVFWLPLLALLALTAWTVLGALDPAATVDVMYGLINLPVQTAKAVAVLGLVWLARRRFRHRLTPEQANDYWHGLMQGKRGPIFVLITDTAVWLVCFVGLLSLFS